MIKLTFNGGIHPYEGKELSMDKPMKRIMPKGEMVYPLLQHIGAPAVPLVAKGDRVLVGQKIAEADGYISSCVSSTVSGTVTSIEPRRVATGHIIMSIIVNNDNEYEEIEYSPEPDYEKLSSEEILMRIKEAGVVGMGGAGFPTNVKLSPKEPDKINYIIANCSECEPYLTSDYRRMIEDPHMLITGLKVAMRLFPNARGILAIEDNKPEAIAKLKKLTVNDNNIFVKVLKTKYPQGAERQLIYASTGRAINSSMLPADAGCIVHNVDTLIAIYHAVIDGMPLMDRIVTITGDAIKDPINVKVKIGTSYNELFEEAGGFKSKPVKVISGGPMMGIGIFDLDVPVTKTASALLCMTRDDVSKEKTTACINCARCVEVCPSRLVPSRLSVYAEHYEEEIFQKWDGMECCECGCCSYVCPAKRPLAQAIKSVRRMLLVKRAKARAKTE